MDRRSHSPFESYVGGGLAPWTQEEVAALVAALTRRKVMAGAGAALLGAVLSDGVGAQTPFASPVDGWTFVDDKGVTIQLETQPVRIVADLIAAAALWDFGIRPVGVFGWDVMADGSFDAAGGRVDRDAVELAGDETVPFDAERAAALHPDLIVTLTDAASDADTYWSIDAKVVSQARQIAPLLAIDSSVRLDLVVSRFAELAIALGADTESDAFVAARADAEAAATAFAEAAEASSDLSALFVYATEEQLFVANPKVASDLLYFRELGLAIPDLDVPDTDYWELLSWEQSLKYPEDMVFVSARSALDIDALKAHPVFSQHPAVQAGQIYTWNGEEPLSYQGIATTLGATRQSVEASSPVS
ncbi:MAG: ABC transporter substrate-binding protein [Thermomicrobiales bacterium]